MSMDYTVGDTIYIKFTTRAFATGIPTTLAGTPVLSAYEDASVTQITAGVSITADLDGVTGLNLATIVATGGNGFESGKHYGIVITTGTVGGVSVIGEVIGQFTLEKSAAAVDLANGTDGLGAIKAETANILTDTGEIGTAGAGLSDITINAASVDLIWDEVLTGGTHNVADSAGRRVRDLQEFGVYEGGAIWIDTVNGTAGTTDYESGTVFNPVDTIADATTLGASLGITRFIIAPNSIITLAQTYNNFVFRGSGWTLALGGQDVGGTLFHGAIVSGIGTGSSPIRFESCDIGACTLHPTHATCCHLEGTITLGLAGDYIFGDCHSGLAGATTPIIDTGAAIANVNLAMPAYYNGIEIRNLNNTGTDLFSISGIGQIIYAASSSGSVEQRGDWKVTNTGGVTIVADDNTTILDTVVSDVWDEILTGATHNIDTSSGRRLRQLLEAGNYEDGFLFINTVDGTAGVVDFENATATNPSDTLTDALTIAASIGGLRSFDFSPDSNWTLIATLNNIILKGHGWILALGGQDIAGSHFFGANVTGISSGATEYHFNDCQFGTATVDPSHFTDCSFSGTLTCDTAGDYIFVHCYSEVAGTGSPVFDVGTTAATNNNLHFRDYSGGIDLRNLGQTGTDNVSIEGNGQIIINANCVGGTIVRRGKWQVTDNSGGAVTIITDDDTTDINAILADTNELQADDVPGLIAALNDISAADVLTTQMTEAYAADGVAPTLAQGIFYLTQLFGDMGVVGTTLTVRKLDGATTAMTFTLDDGTNPTDITRTT